ncbi:hypothetical protein ACKKBF_B39040 [Auxenochlorella protothecoides x Auxenochlorella symbiontica]
MAIPEAGARTDLNRLQTDQTSFFVIRVDASPSTTAIPGGTFVTVESGPYLNLDSALHSLQHPRQRAHVAPDIVFLHESVPVWILDEPVPAKPRMLITASHLEAARAMREPSAPPSQLKPFSNTAEVELWPPRSGRQSHAHAPVEPRGAAWRVDGGGLVVSPGGPMVTTPLQRAAAPRTLDKAMSPGSHCAPSHK